MTSPTRHPGPDFATRTPAYRAPAGATDTHAHIYGPPELFPYVEDRSYTPDTLTDDQYDAMLAAIGFSRAVLVQPSVHGTDNRAMLAAIARHPDTYRGVGIVRAGTPQAELAALHAGGIRGARMQTAVSGGVTFAQLEQLAGEIHPLGWHVVLHFHHGSELVDIAPLLERIANPFILDHVARLTPRDGVDTPAFRTILRLLETDRCYVKLASLYRHSAEPYPFRDWLPMIHALVQARPDRLLWGTNWPHPFHLGVMPNDGDLVDLIPEWIPDPADQHKVLVDNPNRLYGFT